MNRSRLLASVVAVVCLVPALRAATFVVPPDRTLIQNAPAIVLASALSSHAEETVDGGIRTVTVMSIRAVLKGSTMATTISVEEPGGVLGDRAQAIEGVPRFVVGDDYLLFLTNTDNRWHVLDLVLGKFSFQTDDLGHELLVRDAEAIVGWDPKGSPHFELHRDGQGFMTFIRDVVAGREAVATYFRQKNSPIPDRPRPGIGARLASPARLTIAATATFSATSYTFIVSGNLGSRWTVFPAPVTFFSVGTEPGAPAGGTTAITTAIAAWDNDPSSNVNYVYASQDVSGLHTKGIGGSDGENTVMFERDLSAYGVGRFTCSGNSYSGTFGPGRRHERERDAQRS